LAAFRLVHPFPSALNAALVFAIALVAGATLEVAFTLTLAMLGLQFCIGATNDLFDQRIDALSKPYKPIPAGLVSPRAAWVVALASGGVGLFLADLVHPFTFVMAASMLGAGQLYNVWLKSTAFGWVCFSIAFPILPVYAWYGATGTLPPRWELLLPVAALCGPALQLANGLVDLEADRQAGVRTLAVRVGRRPALVVMAALLVAIHALAWLTLAHDAPAVTLIAAAAATALAGTGLALSAQVSSALRGWGWSAQAGSVAMLGVAWLGAATAAA
jgi:4-hydroxybenzoate polyprenyltransferase